MNQRQLVYITGGSSGIGLALAQAYASAGADLVLLARDKSRLEAAVTSCRALAPRDSQRVDCESLDITAYESLPGKLQAVLALYGPPDVAILSAGVAGNATFLETPPAEFDRIVDINLAGSREVARSLMPGMLQRGRGQLVFVSSMAGLIGLYGYSAYSASKFAVTGMVQALRQELAGTGVSAQLVCPPEVDTPMIAAESLSSVPQTRFMKDLVGTLEPADAARKIVAGISRRKAIIVPGARARLLTWIARHFPGVFERCSALLLRWKFK